MDQNSKFLLKLFSWIKARGSGGKGSIQNFGPAPFEIGKQIEYINERHTPKKRGIFQEGQLLRT